MKKNISFECEFCDTEYETEARAIECERNCKEIKEFNRLSLSFDKLFPKRHHKDTKYLKHCVLCGKKLIEIEAVWDGHRNECGDTIFKEPNICILESGRYCHDCYIPHHKKMVEILVRNMPLPKIKP